jgi:hypothetical protein
MLMNEGKNKHLNMAETQCSELTWDW